MKITLETIKIYMAERARQCDIIGRMHEEPAFQLGIAWSVIDSTLNSPERLSELRQELEKLQAEVEATK